MHDSLKNPPTTRAVDAAALRSWLRDVADADSVLEELIDAATEFFQDWTGRALMTQTRILSLDAWPITADALGEWDGMREGAISQGSPIAIELPRSPLASIAEVRVDGSPIADIYSEDLLSEPGRIILDQGSTWPAPQASANGIEIEYVAGYASAALVPATVKIALKQLAAHFYENREAVTEISLSTAPIGVGRIVQQHKVVRL